MNHLYILDCCIPPLIYSSFTVCHLQSCSVTDALSSNTGKVLIPRAANTICCGDFHETNDAGIFCHDFAVSGSYSESSFQRVILTGWIPILWNFFSAPTLTSVQYLLILRWGLLIISSCR